MIVEVKGVQVVSQVRESVDKSCAILPLVSTGRVALEGQLVGQNGVSDHDVLRVLQSQNLSLIIKSRVVLLFYSSHHLPELPQHAEIQNQFVPSHTS